MRVSIEQAANVLGISPRLLRARIQKRIAPIRLLGGPGPAAVDLSDVLQYKLTMPPLQQRKRRAIDKLADDLLTFTRTGPAPRVTGGRVESLSHPSRREPGLAADRSRTAPQSYGTARQ